MLLFMSSAGASSHKQRHDVVQVLTKSNVATEERMDDIREVIIIQITKFLPREQRTDENNV
jgi:hypothetical protein